MAYQEYLGVFGFLSQKILMPKLCLSLDLPFIERLEGYNSLAALVEPTVTRN